MLAMQLASEADEAHAGVCRARIRCYALAPPRVMSLNLAVEYSDVICAVVLQDDFWPRCSTSMVAKIFVGACCG
eukprot:jgi/Mesen1/5270/ME000263S04375